MMKNVFRTTTRYQELADLFREGHRLPEAELLELEQFAETNRNYLLHEQVSCALLEARTA